MKNFIYEIGRPWQSFETLQKARSHMRYVIKQDRQTASLYRDGTGRYYIVRTDVRSGNIRRFYL